MPGYATDVITDLSLDWLSRQDPEQPFCLLVHHKAPHRPWIPDVKHRDLYPVGSIPEPDTLFDDYTTKSRAVREARMSIADDLNEEDVKEALPEHLRGDENRVERTRWTYQRYMRDYLQYIQSIDDNVGRLLDYLDERGQAENAVVVYTSDPSFFLGDHGWYDKRFIYDESLQMPLLVRWPAEIPAGSHTEEIVTNVDFAGTFLDLCGLDADEFSRTRRAAASASCCAARCRGTGRGRCTTATGSTTTRATTRGRTTGVLAGTHKLVYYYADGLGTARPTVRGSRSGRCSTSSPTRASCATSLRPGPCRRAGGARGGARTAAGALPGPAVHEVSLRCRSPVA